MIYFYILVSAFFGGVIRGLVGFIKHQYAYKKVPFDLNYFLGMSFLSGIIGLMAGASVEAVGFSYNGLFTPAISFIIGYAGGDFLENIYKIIIKKSSIYREKKD